VAWVGGADHQVRAIGLADGQVGATWRHGAAVTAVAVVPGGWLVIGDATGRCVCAGSPTAPWSIARSWRPRRSRP
jgi:hypothetical protein